MKLTLGFKSSRTQIIYADTEFDKKQLLQVSEYFHLTDIHVKDRIINFVNEAQTNRYHFRISDLEYIHLEVQ